MRQDGLLDADIKRMLDESLSDPRDGIVIHLLALGFKPNEIMGWSKCPGVKIEDWDREQGTLTIIRRRSKATIIVKGTRLDTLLKMYVPSLKRASGRMIPGGVNLIQQIVKRVASQARIPNSHKVTPMMFVHIARMYLDSHARNAVAELVTSFSP